MTLSDGRRTRWDEHRQTRRSELLRATLRAIRKHGANVSMEQIAAMAGTSKPVIYRHFGDRAGIYRAVVDSVHDYIADQLDVDAAGVHNALDVISALTETYLTMVADDPGIYRFVVTRPMADAPVADPVTSIGGRIASKLEAVLTPYVPAGASPLTANAWAHGIVGSVWAVTEHWFAEGLQRPRADVVADVTSLYRNTFTATAQGAPR